MMGKRNRHMRPLTLAVCVLLTALLFLMTAFAAVPENGNNMQTRSSERQADDNRPVAGAVTDGAEAIGDAVTDAANAVGDVVSDVGEAAGDVVSDAGEAVGDAADAIGGNTDHREDAVTDNAGGTVGGTQNDPAVSGALPYDSQSVVTPGAGNTAGTTTAENNSGSFTWIWILILTAAAAAIFFLILMPGQRRRT